MIEGVVITPLKQILDERGKVMHMLKVTDPAFTSFGEIYFSCIYPNVVKAWHRHRAMTLNYAVPHGRIKLALFDDRENSSTKNQVQEIYLGEDNYCLVTIPPLIWNGFKGFGSEMAVVANFASVPHDPLEIERREPEDPEIPYNWAIRHR